MIKSTYHQQTHQYALETVVDFGSDDDTHLHDQLLEELADQLEDHDPV